MKYIIGVDLGGTKIYSGIFENGKMLKILKFWTEGNKGKKAVINNILKSIDAIIKESEISKDNIGGIGIASPGPLDYRTGNVVKTPNLPISGVNLRKIIEKEFKIKTKVDNDAKCGGFAEAKARRTSNLIYLTLGTGLGSAMIYNGEIFRGDLYATEFGHQVIDYNGFECSCGNKGCLEIYTNSNALLRYARELGLDEDGYEIHKKALAGDKRYKKVYEILGKYLGVGIANIVNSVDINLIAIGGGIGNAGDLIIKPALNEMKSRLLVRKNVRIEKAKLGEFANLIGSAMMFD